MKRLFFFFAVLVALASANAQRIGMNCALPDISTALAVSSTAQGVLVISTQITAYLWVMI